MLGKKLNNFILIFVCVFFSRIIIDRVRLFRIKYFMNGKYFTNFTIECFTCKYFSIVAVVKIIMRKKMMVI
jgi:hypothetical protein